MNNTSAMLNVSLASATSPDLSPEFRIVKISIYVIIFVLTIIGNGLVISVITHDRRMRSSPHILVFNLAICDLITPTISLPFDLAYEELHYNWPFGSTMCKLLWPAQTFSATSSALILTAICIDRYRALVYPFKVRWAGKFCLMICSLYILSILVVVPYVFVLRQVKVGETFDCTEKWPHPQKKFRQAYTMLLCLLQYFLPLFIMIALYSITLRSLFNNSKSLPGMLAGEMPSSSDNQEAEKRINALKEMRKEQHVKVTKMFIMVVIVFAISMFPNQIFWLWVDYGSLALNEHFSMTSIICRIFTYSNSVLNPFIYGLYSKDFRKGYRKAGRRISKVHQKQSMYYNVSKKHQCNSFNMNESETKLLHCNANGTTRPVSSKKVHFSLESTSETRNKTEVIDLKNSEVKSSNIDENHDSFDLNSNAKQKPSNPINIQGKQSGHLKGEDIKEEKDDCYVFDDLDTDYLNALQETPC